MVKEKGIEVWKNNSLLNAKARWNVHEQKIFSILLSDFNQEKGRSFKIEKGKLEEILGVFLATEELRLTVRSMVRKGFSVYHDKNDWGEIQLFSSIKYFKGVLTINLTEEAMPYVYELQKYTKYLLGDITPLKKRYSIRTFELLKREEFKKRKSFEIPIDELRDFYGLTEKEYRRFYDFEQNVLKSSKDEINKSTSMKFEIEKIKYGRKVVAIKFIYTLPEEETFNAPKYMNFKEFSKVQLRNIMQEGVQAIDDINSRNDWTLNPQDYILAQVRYTKSSNYKNFYGFLIGSLKDDWAGFEESRNVELNQISIDDIQVEKKKPRKEPIRVKKSKKDFTEREYDYDDLERKLLGWENL